MSAQLKDHRLVLSDQGLLPRELVVDLSALGNLTAQVFVRREDDLYPVAYMHQPLTLCHLDTDSQDLYCLWMNGAAFDVTPAEAQQIHEHFAHLGLRSQYQP